MLRGVPLPRHVFFMFRTPPPPTELVFPSLSFAVVASRRDSDKVFCKNCIAGSSPVWMEGRNKELLCQTCGNYYAKYALSPVPEWHTHSDPHACQRVCLPCIAHTCLLRVHCLCPTPRTVVGCCALTTCFLGLVRTQCPRWPVGCDHALAFVGSMNTVSCPIPSRPVLSFLAVAPRPRYRDYRPLTVRQQTVAKARIEEMNAANASFLLESLSSIVPTQSPASEAMMQAVMCLQQDAAAVRAPLRPSPFFPVKRVVLCCAVSSTLAPMQYCAVGACLCCPAVADLG